MPVPPNPPLQRTDVTRIMRGRWRYVLLGSVLALAALHFLDAFFVEFPALALVLGVVLFLVSAYWLARGAQASVVFAGVLCLARLVLAIAFSIAGPTESLSIAERVLVVAFAIASACGVVAAVGMLRLSRLESSSRGRR